MYAHILIPTDGSPLAEQAVSKGLELASALGAAVTVATVVEPFAVLTHFVSAEHARLRETYETFEREAEAHAGRVLDAARAAAEAKGVTARTLQIQSGYPAEAIVQAAEEQGADLIVMASHGRRGMAALMIGSETTKVLTHTKIPVLVLR